MGTRYACMQLLGLNLNKLPRNIINIQTLHRRYLPLRLWRSHREQFRLEHHTAGISRRRLLSQQKGMSCTWGTWWCSRFLLPHLLSSSRFLTTCVTISTCLDPTSGRPSTAGRSVKFAWTAKAFYLPLVSWKCYKMLPLRCTLPPQLGNNLVLRFLLESQYIFFIFSESS